MYDQISLQELKDNTPYLILDSDLEDEDNEHNE